MSCTACGTSQILKIKNYLRTHGDFGLGHFDIVQSCYMIVTNVAHVLALAVIGRLSLVCCSQFLVLLVEAVQLPLQLQQSCCCTLLGAKATLLFFSDIERKSGGEEELGLYGSLPALAFSRSILELRGSLLTKRPGTPFSKYPHVCYYCVCTSSNATNDFMFSARAELLRNISQFCNLDIYRLYLKLCMRIQLTKLPFRSISVCADPDQN